MPEYETSSLERMQTGEIDEQRRRIADESMKRELRKAQGVMQVTTTMLVHALKIIEQYAPARLSEFPAAEEDAIDRAARDYVRRKLIDDESTACIFCQCTKENACITEGKPCHWVAPNVCSACVEKFKQFEAGSVIVQVKAKPKKLRTRSKLRSAKPPARKRAKKSAKKRRVK